MRSEIKASHQLHGFARRLVAEGLLEEQVAIEASLSASKNGLTILAWIIKNIELDTHALTQAASVEYGVPVIDIKAVDLSILPQHGHPDGSHW